MKKALIAVVNITMLIWNFSHLKELILDPNPWFPILNDIYLKEADWQIRNCNILNLKSRCPLV